MVRLTFPFDLNTYRMSGVQEYWIIDQKQENIIDFAGWPAGGVESFAKAISLRAVLNVARYYV